MDRRGAAQPPNYELCHETSDPESVPKNGQLQLRAHARAAFAGEPSDAQPWQALVPDFKGQQPPRTGWHAANAAWKRGCAGLLPSSY